jgi:hypothetical protein
MSIRFIVSQYSMSHMTLNCDSLDKRYDVSGRKRIVSIARWDQSLGRNVMIGQFRIPIFSQNQIKLGEDGEWRPMKEVFYRSKGEWWMKSVS